MGRPLSDCYVPPIYRFIAWVHGLVLDLREARFVAKEMRK